MNTNLPFIDQKTVEATFLFFLSMSVAARVLLLGSLAIITLFFFTVMLDAISELSQHIAQVYTASDALTRLVIFVLAVLFCRKVFPYAARIFKGI